MKIGLDFHGVIDKYPNLFRIITNGFNINDVEVHIVTGCRRRDIFDYLQKHDIYFTYIYSITDYFLREKCKYKLDKYKRPYFNGLLWNKAKAKYCKINEIDIMIDDSEIYGKYFNTPYILFKGIK